MMILTHKDRRGFPRIDIDCDVTYHSAGDIKRRKGQAIDLSGSGIRFRADASFNTGTHIQVSIIPTLKMTYPLDETIEVIRSIEDEQCGYQICGTFLRNDSF